MVKLQAPQADELGFARELGVREIGGTKCLVLQQDSSMGQISTIVLRGSTEQVRRVVCSWWVHGWMGGTSSEDAGATVVRCSCAASSSATAAVQPGTHSKHPAFLPSCPLTDGYLAAPASSFYPHPQMLDDVERAMDDDVNGYKVLLSIIHPTTQPPSHSRHYPNRCWTMWSVLWTMA